MFAKFGEFAQNESSFVLSLDLGPHSSYRDERKDPVHDGFVVYKIGPEEVHRSVDLEVLWVGSIVRVVELVRFAHSST